MQVAYNGVKRDNKWMGEREWHAIQYTRGFRMGRRTEDNLFMLAMMIGLVNVRKVCLFVFIWEKLML